MVGKHAIVGIEISVLINQVIHNKVFMYGKMLPSCEILKIKSRVLHKKWLHHMPYNLRLLDLLDELEIDTSQKHEDDHLCAFAFISSLIFCTVNELFVLKNWPL